MNKSMVIRMIIGTTMLFAGGGLVFAAGQGGRALDDKAKEAAVGMKMGATVNVFRLGAASNADAAVGKWGSPEFVAKWGKLVASNFTADEKIELQDFFSSAVVWVGPVEGTRAVVGLYSPWSDGLMLVTLKEAGANSVLEDFQFICGESWRGVADPSADEVLALYQLKEPLTLAAARLYAPSVELFKRHYPATGKVELVPPAVKALIQPMESELLMIKVRMMVRMKMYQTYFAAENRPAVVAASHLMKTIKEGDRAKMKASLGAEQSADMIDSICRLPAVVRNGFAPNYFGKGADGMILGLVNPAAPRWLVAAQVKPGGSVMVELMDLEVSGRILIIAKEVKP